MEESSRLVVLQTKTILPRRSSHLLTRQRLIDMLYDVLDYRLFLVTAPAGYGKTSLLVDWANQAELPICWYALDDLDQEPRRFFYYFISTLAKRFPSFGHSSHMALQNMTRNLDVQRLVLIVVNDAFDHIQEHFALILDDFHLLGNNADINTFISGFVQQADENCHLVLASRALLSLPDMPLMVARSQAGGLGFEDLAFQAEEIQALVHQNYHLKLPPSEAEALVQETEGWITGVLLSTQPTWQGIAERMRGIRSTGTELYDYMAHQVLDKQPPRLRDFLLRTSLLGEYDASLCQTVLGDGQDWSTLMGEVQQSNLFVLSVGDEGKWLRYHHLFLQFLQSRMEQENPHEYETILRRLARVYTERGVWDKAYAIYQRLGDLEETAAFLAIAGEPMVKEGRITLLNRWLDALPHDKSTLYPELLARHGMTAVMGGQTELGLQRLVGAVQALKLSGDYPHLIGSLVWRATAYRFLGDYKSAHEDADLAMSLFEKHGGPQDLWAQALRIKGLSLYWQGDLGAATTWLKRCLSIFQELPNKQDEALLLMELGLATMAKGAYAQALKYYTQALPYWQQGFDPVRKATLLNNVGVLQHLMGDYELAASTLEQAVTTAHESGYVRTEALAYASLGDLYIDLGAFDAAQEAYNQVNPLAHQMNDRFLLLYMNVARATLAEYQLAFRQAALYLDQAWELVEAGNSDYEYGLWYLVSGRLAAQGDNFPQAVEYLHQAEVRFTRGGQQAELAKTHLYLGIVSGMLDRKDSAESHLAQAFYLTSEVQSQNLLVLAACRIKDKLIDLSISPGIDIQIAGLLDKIYAWEQQLPALRRRLRRRSTAVSFAPQHLTLHAFGEPQVLLDNKAVTNTQWQSLAARDMLFCLLAHPAGLSGEGLGELFWSDKSPPKLKLHLKKTLYRLRRALQQNVVIFQNGRYAFNFYLDYEYDVEVFRQNIQKGQDTVSINSRIKAYRAAVESYRGYYLSGIDGYWILVEREKLWQAFRQVALFLANHYLSISSPDKALAYCQRVLEYDPCVEQAHTIAMQVYALQGQNAEVALQYERCKQCLHTELGVQPSPKTQALFLQLTETSNTP
jgi:LuxR family maltose regulon positive regulatory protein